MDLNDMKTFYNPVISTVKHEPASDGDMYYDTQKGLIMARIRGEWVKITNNVTPSWPEQLKETLKKL